MICGNGEGVLQLCFHLYEMVHGKVHGAQEKLSVEMRPL